MLNEKPKPELRLILQASVPIEDVTEAEDFYKQLKEMLNACSENMTCSGQITKMLEPCCGEKAKTNLYRGVVDPESRDYR